MKTVIYDTDSSSLEKAAQVIKNGGLVAFPTETVYGLGACGFMPQSVNKIFKVKGRPNDNPLILHIGSYEQIYDLALEIPEQMSKLKKFMPGPLTVVLKRKDIVPDEVTAGLNTVGIRIPSQPDANAFLKMCGVPVAAPSANISGRPSPTTFGHVVEDLDGKVDGIIRGEVCSVGLESTVLDLSTGEPTILRPGAITREMLEEALGIVYTGGDGNRPKAPGMKYKHYAPKAPLYVVDGDILDEIAKYNGKKIGVMLTDNISLDGDIAIQHLGNNPQEYAHNLFKALRYFDSAKVDVILSQDIKGDGICEAVRNRLYKAANNR
ncbi:MAG: L-threonylcarbamoyladenylate synthase [Eubacteriales bacterium]|nr:L-threonylcarbamoyladenylate synthase [Eubacteriales bacterium]